MPKTLLAVDDSATMRKVLEITFGGEDYRVVTADSAQSALGKLSEEPKVVVIDTVLGGGDDGYALCKEVRKRDASAVIVLLSSRHNPYDQARGADAGADDYMDKPFDTQQMADKVKKAVVAREGGAGPAYTPQKTQTGGTEAVARPAPPPQAAAPAPSPFVAQPPPPKPTTGGRANTLMFGGDLRPPTAQPPAAPPAPPPQASPFVAPYKAPTPAAPPVAAAPPPAAIARSVVPSPQPPKVAPAPPLAPPPQPAAAVAAGVSRATVQVNGQLTGKLADLGLSQEQVQAVLALSRDVVERVVWEVVPELAEMLIKEEITRLTKG